MALCVSAVLSARCTTGSFGDGISTTGVGAALAMPVKPKDIIPASSILLANHFIRVPPLSLYIFAITHQVTRFDSISILK